MTSRFAFVLALVLVGFAPRPVHADDPATRASRRHFDRGEKLFALGKFSDALDEYQKAFDAKPLPDFLFNIGQCYRNLGDYDQAIFSFKKYLQLEPDAQNQASVQELIDELESKKEHSDAQKLTARPPPPPRSPIYSRWWFIAGVSAAAIAGGIGIYEATRTNPPATDLGNIQFGK